MGVLLLSKDAFVDEVRTLEDPLRDEERTVVFAPPGVFFLGAGGKGE